jgi:acetyl-CoA acetyltransferase
VNDSGSIHTDTVDTRQLLRHAAISGVYTTELGDLQHRSTDDLLLEAITGAAENAGLTLADIDGIAGGRSSTASAATAFPGYWSELLGHSVRYFSNVDAASAAHCGNMLHASLAVATGLARNIVCIGGGSRGASRAEAVQKMAYAHGEFDVSWGTVVPSWFALIARRHMHEYGTTSEQLAEVAVSTRKWASMHPQAIKRDLITIADVVNSRMISDPLHMLDCCLSNDGAGALVISRAACAADGPNRPIYMLGGAEDYTFRGYVGTGHDWLKSGALYTGKRALEMAGVHHAEIDVAELYDCFTITVVRELEDLGFCKPGEGGDFVTGGRLAPGGALPTNTHGGGLSYGHMYSGLSHAIEAVRQLRGECGERQVPGAEIAMVHSQGGPLAMHSTAILSSVR